MRIRFDEVDLDHYVPFKSEEEIEETLAKRNGNKQWRLARERELDEQIATLEGYRHMEKPLWPKLVVGAVFLGLTYVLAYILELVKLVLPFRHAPAVTALTCMAGIVVVCYQVNKRLMEKKFGKEALAFGKLTPEAQQQRINELSEESFTYTEWHRETGYGMQESGLFTNPDREQASAEFEYRVYYMLEGRRGYTRASVFLPAPGGRTTEIDLLHINENGIYVFECKNMPGTFWGREEDESLSYSHNGQQRTIHNPFKQNHGHILAVQAALRKEPALRGTSVRVYNVVVTPDETDFSGVEITSRDTFFVHRSRLPELFDHRYIYEPDDEIRYSGAHMFTLDAAIEKARLRGNGLREQHVASIQARQGHF